MPELSEGHPHETVLSFSCTRVLCARDLPGWTTASAIGQPWNIRLKLYDAIERSGKHESYSFQLPRFALTAWDMLASEHMLFLSVCVLLFVLQSSDGLGVARVRNMHL